MTRDEFDKWIEDQYSKLRAVALRRYPNDDPEEILQTALAGMLDSPGLANVVLDPTATTRMGVWPWAVSFLRSTASHARRAERRRLALKKEVDAGASLGERGNKRAPPRKTE